MDIENTLVMQGGAIKAMGEGSSEGRPVGKLGGVLCRFSSADDPDQTRDRDFFDGETNFKLADGMTTPVYYHHGLHAGVGVKEIGQGVLRQGRNGIDIECGLWLDDADGARYYREAAAGRLAWSSGTAAHLVKRTPVTAQSGAVAHHIDFWPLGLDASLTPHAAEPRNVAVALKALMGMGEEGGEVGSRQREEAGEVRSGQEGGDGETLVGERQDDMKSLEILEAGQLEGSRLVDHTARLREAIAEYVERIAIIGADRAAKAGRGFTLERQEELSELLGEIRGAGDGLGEVLTAHGPTANDELEEQMLRQQMMLQELELDGVLWG